MNESTPELRLRSLFRERRALQDQAQDLENKAKPHTTKKGVVVQPRFDQPTCKEIVAFADSMREKVSTIEDVMKRELKEVPIYNEFFKKVWGCGPITAAILIANVNVHHKEDTDKGATKPSSVIQFCGFGVHDGKLSRMVSGKTRDYHPDLRDCLFNLFTTMSKNRGAWNKTNKYLVIYDGKKHGIITGPRVQPSDKGPQIDGHPAQAFAHQTAWHTAMRVFLEDMYVIWRAQLGLPVWPSYHAAQMGYSHGGKICVAEPKLLTLEAAWEIVGHVGKYCPQCNSQLKCDCFKKDETTTTESAV